MNWSVGLKSFHFELPCLEKKSLEDVGFKPCWATYDIWSGRHDSVRSKLIPSDWCIMNRIITGSCQTNAKHASSIFDHYSIIVFWVQSNLEKEKERKEGKKEKKERVSCCCCCKYFISNQEEYLNDRSLHSVGRNCDKNPCGQKIELEEDKDEKLTTPHVLVW